MMFAVICVLIAVWFVASFIGYCSEEEDDNG